MRCYSNIRHTYRGTCAVHAHEVTGVKILFSRHLIGVCMLTTFLCLMFHARHSTVHVWVTKMCGAFSLHLPSFSKHWLFTWTVRMLPMKTPPQNWATGRQNDKRLGCCSRVHRKSCECSTCHVLNDSNNDDEATQVPVLDLSLITQIIDLLASKAAAFSNFL